MPFDLQLEFIIYTEYRITTIITILLSLWADVLHLGIGFTLQLALCFVYIYCPSYQSSIIQ